MNTSSTFIKKDKFIYITFLFTTGMVLFIFFPYLDRSIVLSLRTFDYDHSFIGKCLKMIDPIVDYLSHGITLLAFSIILCLIGRFRNIRLYESGKCLIVGFLFSGLAAQILKYSIGRARPRLTSATILNGLSMRDDYHSFPSGHATVAFCFAYILSHFCPRYYVIFYFIACIVGFERVEDLKHFPSDVLAGALIGIIVGRVLIASKYHKASN